MFRLSKRANLGRAGDLDQAFAWLEKACGLHPQGLVDITVDFGNDNVRSLPRHQNLRRHMSFPVNLRID